ncbi:nitroreductase family protein [Polynucleobacter sp. HIN8]|uniref:nitroreductase family protein n=1 Tax=Polynucleobacter sp. HIN8 TaxID=3047867 RepID=UPI002572B263|nr:nitroreductase family protein [Polynucleobacter sp. HIN8]
MDGEINCVLKAIVNRGIEKKLANYPISRNLIEILLDSGMRISSYSKTIPWSYVVIQDEDYITYLQDYAKAFNHIHSDNTEANANNSFDSRTHSSDALIVLYANVENSFSLNKCWQSVENILLAGRALGLNVSIDCSLLRLLNSIKLKQELNVPENLSVLYVLHIASYINTYLPATINKPTVWSWLDKYS